MSRSKTKRDIAQSVDAEYQKRQKHVEQQQLQLWFTHLTKRIAPDRLVLEMRRVLPAAWTRTLNDFYTPRANQSRWNTLDKNLVRLIIPFLHSATDGKNWFSANHLLRQYSGDLGFWQRMQFRLSKVAEAVPKDVKLPSWFVQQTRDIRCLATIVLDEIEVVAEQDDSDEDEDNTSVYKFHLNTTLVKHLQHATRLKVTGLHWNERQIPLLSQFQHLQWLHLTVTRTNQKFILSLLRDSKFDRLAQVHTLSLKMDHLQFHGKALGPDSAEVILINALQQSTYKLPQLQRLHIHVQTPYLHPPITAVQYQQRYLNFIEIRTIRPNIQIDVQLTYNHY